MTKKNTWLFALLISIFSIIGGYFIGKTFGRSHRLADCPEVYVPKETRLGGYKFINPLLECQPFEHPVLATYTLLEIELKKYVAQVKKEGKATHVSIYFRDLNNGPWVGLDQEEQFSPASLLKVPIMIAALKKEEQQPGFLKKEVFYGKHTDDLAKPNITDPLLIKIGKTYTIDQLILGMIAHSDNEAKNLILANIDDALFNKVFTDLGITIPEVRTSDDFMTIRSYSSFFRVLYNATYLNKNLSEKALGYLSQSSFNKGIRAGLPTEISVENKFGERALEGSTLRQLHDCGIVYFDNKPYLICVMTRGNDFVVQEQIISTVSKMIFDGLRAK
jgi:beta-lactamase class A